MRSGNDARPALPCGVMHRRFLSVLLLLALVSPGAGSATLYTCHMDGQTRTSCCCEHEGGESGAQVRRAGDECCDIRVVAQAPRQVSRTVASADVVTVIAPVVWVLPLLPGAPALAEPVRFAPPQPHGPPLFMQKSSFLL